MFDKTVNGIRIYESENPPDLVDMTAEAGLIFCKKFANEFRLRRSVCIKIVAAQKNLPAGYRFMIYEAFRSRSRQIELWKGILVQLHREHPDWNDALCEKEASNKYVANPYGLGSGHQAGAAVDLTLCDAAGREIFMGTAMDEFCAKTPTDSKDVGKEEMNNRRILRAALEAEGVINYPDEWWHFSYGDRLWANVTKRSEAFFAPID